MKKLYTLFLFVIAIAGFSQSIPFAGTGLLSANGWVETGTPITPATSFPGSLSILNTLSDSGNSLSYSGLAASTGNRTSTIHNNTQDCNFAITSNTGTTYYSLLIKVASTTGMFSDFNTATPAVANTGEYFIHLASTAGTGATAFVGRVYVKAGTTANTFKLAVLNGSGGTATPTYSTTEYAVATTHFLVVKYERSGNSVSLFANPTPGTVEPATASTTNATGTSAAPAQVAAICIRQSGSVTATASTGTIEIDEIRVGDNWATVTPAADPLAINNFQNKELLVYVNNKILYTSPDSNKLKTVTLYDILGKQVLNSTTSGSSINVSDLLAGIYIVKVTEEGKTATRKLVIQ